MFCNQVVFCASLHSASLNFPHWVSVRVVLVGTSCAAENAGKKGNFELVLKF